MSDHEIQEHDKREADPQAAEPVAPVVVRAGKPARRGRVAAVTACVLLAGALVAGVAHTVVTVRGADRDAGAPTWKFPQVKAEEEKVTARPGLAGVLVPYSGDSWSEGPDLAEFGSDAQLGGAQATALRKEAVSGLPRAQRKQLEKAIDRQRIKGMAMRSYYSQESNGYRSDGMYSVSIVLAQMENRAAVRASSTAQNRFLASLDVFSDVPKIKGYEKNAGCYRLPGDDEEALDMMLCSAYVGDVLVTATAYGPNPMVTEGVTTLLRTQLDRITEPGEAV
ncbi:hypothetical protein PV396_26070 [Streptomyces sp. ME02-8801-2C]|uniref:hypothetical protein n=1 Tax=Streptomyces sp. ME02-8801-2C TaxID=3028680 RepID=UPI0029A1E540|nr:hypothetical protein [Streptomyces sp. ME02-8801-2C]MDX3455363.1 hypothetical protein [Streptomyces sp. ME02-8801-2C]